jgi:hypothetical protein
MHFSSDDSRANRFSLRTLILMTSVACLLFGEIAHYLDTYRQQLRSLTAALNNNGHATIVPANGPFWCRWLVTETVGPNAFVHVTSLDFPPASAVDDNVVKQLDGMVFLQAINLDHSQVTGSCLPILASLPALTKLSLRYTPLSDTGAAQLGRLQRLHSLYLTGTPLTDAAVADLADMRRLNEIYIRWSDITDSGALRLEQSLPMCAVYFDAASEQRGLAPKTVASAGP